MSVQKSPADADAAVRLVLTGLAAGTALDEISTGLHGLWDERTGFPGEVLLDLAAEAYLLVGATHSNPLDLDRIDMRYLPERPARRNAGHQKRRYAVTGAVLLTAGALPEDYGWWSVNDLYVHAFHAVVIFVRAAADRRNVPVEVICGELGDAWASRAG